MTISHLSGFWWLVGGAISWLALSILFFSTLELAKRYDRRAAEMGAK
jgi:hypothetical protein